MEKQLVVKALKELKENSAKRNFSQTVDLVISLQNLDMKKQENNVDQFVALHYDRGKKLKICALVGPELTDQAKQVFDLVITLEEMMRLKDNKKAARKLAAQYDFFIAQANIMPQVATVFGRVFGPRGKMPNPKAGCVVPPNANLKALYEKLQKTLRVQTKTQPAVKCGVGTEKMNEEHVVDNIMTVYNAIMHVLPNAENSVKSVALKLTMGKPIPIGAKVE